MLSGTSRHFGRALPGRRTRYAFMLAELPGNFVSLAKPAGNFRNPHLLHGQQRGCARACERVRALLARVCVR